MGLAHRLGCTLSAVGALAACGDRISSQESPTSSTSATTTSGGQGGSAQASGLENYAFRRAIVMTGTVLPGHSFSIALDHAKLVADKKASASGDDVRIGYAAGDAYVELDRVLEPRAAWNDGATRLWFRTPEDAAPSTEYLVFYGNDAPAAPLADPTKVYLHWEGFDGDEAPDGWTVSTFGGAVGSVELVAGALRLRGKSGDFGGTEDSAVLYQRAVSGDFVAELELAGTGGSLGGDAKLGGLMLRASEEASAAFAMLTLRELPRERLSISRVTAGGAATATALPVAATFPQVVQLKRLASEVTAAYSDDGATFIALGPPQNLSALTDPVLLGVPFANVSGDFGYVDVAWFRAYRRVSPPPTTSLGDELEN